MRTAASISQMTLMAVIVAMLFYWPVGVALALLLGLFGIPPDAFVTFGGALNRYAGMLVWWLAVFLLALVYAAFAFPWDHAQGWRKK